MKRQGSPLFLKKDRKQFPQDKGRKMRNLRLIISLAKALLRHPEGKRRLHFNYFSGLPLLFLCEEEKGKKWIAMDFLFLIKLCCWFRVAFWLLTIQSVFPFPFRSVLGLVTRDDSAIREWLNKWPSICGQTYWEIRVLIICTNKC